MPPVIPSRAATECSQEVRQPTGTRKSVKDAAALVARDLGDGGPEAGRRFDHYVTYDRPLVLAAADDLLRQIVRSD